MTDWKKVKITEKKYIKRENQDKKFIMLVLDEILVYEGEVGMFINCVNSHPFDTYQAGDYLEIDSDRIKYENKYGVFSDTSVVRKVLSSTNIITTRGSSSNIVISSGLANAMGSSETMELARHMSRMVDENDKEYELKIEDNTNTRFTYSLICRKQK